MWPREERPKHCRDRARNQRLRGPVLLRVFHRGAPAGRRGGGRERLLHDAGVGPRTLAPGRALFPRHRVPQPAAPACLGLRRCPAALSSLPWGTARRRRRSAEVGGADGAVRRARRRCGARPLVSGQRQQPERRASVHRLRSRRGRRRREQQLAGGPLLSAGLAEGSELRRTWTARGHSSRTHSAAPAVCGLATSSGNGRRRGTRPIGTSSFRPSTSGATRTAGSPSTRRGCSATPSSAPTPHASTAGTPRRSTNSCRTGASACATTN